MAASGQPTGATPSRPHQPDTQSAPGVGTASVHRSGAGDTQLLCCLAARIISATQIGTGRGARRGLAGGHPAEVSRGWSDGRGTPTSAARAGAARAPQRSARRGPHPEETSARWRCQRHPRGVGDLCRTAESDVSRGNGLIRDSWPRSETNAGRDLRLTESGCFPSPRPATAPPPA